MPTVTNSSGLQFSEEYIREILNISEELPKPPAKKPLSAIEKRKLVAIQKLKCGDLIRLHSANGSLTCGVFNSIINNLFSYSTYTKDTKIEYLSLSSAAFVSVPYTNFVRKLLSYTPHKYTRFSIGSLVKIKKPMMRYIKDQWPNHKIPKNIENDIFSITGCIYQNAVFTIAALTIPNKHFVVHGSFVISVDEASIVGPDDFDLRVVPAH